MSNKVSIGVDGTYSAAKWYDTNSSSAQVSMLNEPGASDGTSNFKIKKRIGSSDTEIMRIDDDGKVTFYKNVSFDGGSSIVNATTTSIQDQQLEIGLTKSINVGSVTKYDIGSGSGPCNYRFTVSSARANHAIGESWSYTGSSSTSVWTSAEDHGLSVGDIIQFASGSGSVTNFSQDTNYYVKTASSKTITLSSSITESTISAINVTAGGSGYTSAPTVTISADDGSSATATATVSGGAVTSITVNAAGSGYNNGAKITISGGGGSGATATATLADVPGSVLNGGSGETVTSWTSNMMSTFSSGKYIYLQNAKDSSGAYLTEFQAALQVIDSTATTFTVQTTSNNTLDLTTYPVIASQLTDLTNNTGMFLLANNSGTLVEAKVAYDNNSDKGLIVENTAGKIKVGSENVDQNIEIGRGGTRSILVGNSDSTTTEVELNAVTVDVNGGSGGITMNSSGATAITSGSTLGITATSGNTTFDCTGRTLDINAATLDMDLTAASSINTTGANLDITTTTSGDININSVADLDLDGATVNVNSSGATAITSGSTLGITATSGNTTFDCTGRTLDINAATLDMDLTAASSINTTGANLDITTTTSGDININSVADLDLDGATVTVNSSGATAITSGSTLGITATSGETTIDCAGQTLDINAATLEINSTDATNLTMTANSSSAKTLTIAATNSGSANSNLDVDADGTVSIDGAAGINIGTASDVAVDIDAAAFTLDASGTLGITSSNTSLTIASGTGNLNISNDGAATTVNIGTGSGAKTTTLGSTNTTSSTTLQSGSGAMTLTAGAAFDVNASGAVTIDGSSIGIGTASDVAVDFNASTFDLDTSGTGNDAIALTSTAGGITNTYDNAKNFTITDDDSGAKNSLVFTGNSTAGSRTITLTNGQGTGNDAIALTSTAGGITNTYDNAKNFTITDDDSGAKNSLVFGGNSTAGSRTITLTNGQGTGNDAIALTSTAGGITNTYDNAKNFTITDDDSGAKNSLVFGGNSTAGSRTITLTNGQGTGDDAIALTSTAGGITNTYDNAKNFTITDDDGTAADRNSLVFTGNSTATSRTITLTNGGGNGNSSIGLISTAGGITLTTNSSKDVTVTYDLTVGGELASSSDRRLKKNIKNLEGSLDKINNLRGVSFKWKEKKKEDHNISGFIAQEVEEIIPNLVSNNNDGFKTVNYIGVIPHLVEAIKEQQKMIEELKAKIENK